MKYIVLVLWTFSLFLLMFSSFPSRVECRPTRAMGPGPPSPYLHNNNPPGGGGGGGGGSCPVLEDKLNPWPELQMTDVTMKVWETPIILEGTARSRSEIRPDGSFGVTFDLHRVVKGDAPLLRRRKQFRLQFLDNPNPPPENNNDNNNNRNKGNLNNRRNNNNNKGNNKNFIKPNNASSSLIMSSTSTSTVLVKPPSPYNSYNKPTLRPPPPPPPPLPPSRGSSSSNTNSYNNPRKSSSSTSSIQTKQLIPAGSSSSTSLQLYNRQQQHQQLVRQHQLQLQRHQQSHQRQQQQQFQQNQNQNQFLQYPSYRRASNITSPSSSYPLLYPPPSSSYHHQQRTSSSSSTSYYGSRRGRRSGRSVVGPLRSSSSQPTCLPPKSTVKTGRRYYVFAAKVDNHFIAVFSPELANKRNTKGVDSILCKGCGQAPSVVAAQKEIGLQLKERLRLRCRLRTGNPIPFLTWYKDGKPINYTDPRFRLRTKRRQSIFVIRKARESDTGHYKCEAKNAFGSAYASVRVTLNSSPSSVPNNKVINPSNRNNNKPKLPSSSSIKPDRPLGGGGGRPPPSSSSSRPIGSWTTPTTLWPLEARECPYNSYCLNGGTCSYFETIGEYVCQCAEGYKGQRCDTKDISSSGSPSSSDYESTRRMLMLWQ